ncbi:MAG TPA: CPBP family intramembrane metalloprotease [Planctomycetota bacterium]|jgi:hypothetical protein|nr:CPBP family intramembrane metalloprotease [Planctomycetota bacterium]
MQALSRYLKESRRWENSVLLVVPLLVLYQLGLVWTDVPVRNAAEVYILRALASLLRMPAIVGREGILVLNSAVLLAFLVASVSRRHRPAESGTLKLLALECLLWALVLAPAILVIRRFLAVFLRAGAPTLSPLEEAVMGLGAGLYEELLFRLILIAGGYVILVRGFHVDPLWAQVSLILSGAILFSAFHHMGTYGEPYVAEVFVFRFLAGVIFGLLYVWRGLAVVCWSHALYDVLLVVTDSA